MNLRLMAAASMACVVLAAGQAGAQSTEVGVKGGSLVLDHPRDWKGTVSGPLVGPTLRLVPGSQGDFKILITAIVSQAELPDDVALADQVRAQGEKLLPTSVQTTLEVTRMKGAQARGYMYHLTDRKPEKSPGDFRELHQGAVVVVPLILSVTVLTHTEDSATVKAAVAARSDAAPLWPFDKGTQYPGN